MVGMEHRQGFDFLRHCVPVPWDFVSQAVFAGEGTRRFLFPQVPYPIP